MVAAGGNHALDDEGNGNCTDCQFFGRTPAVRDRAISKYSVGRCPRAKRLIRHDGHQHRQGSCIRRPETIGRALADQIAMYSKTPVWRTTSDDDIMHLGRTKRDVPSR